MMVDAKTMLIGAGLLFLVWSCSGVNAQTSPAAAAQPGDKNACYAAVNAAVGDAWAGLSFAERAGVGAKAIGLCEGGGQ